MSFTDCDIRQWKENPWATIADAWMLITAGTLPAPSTARTWNTMTASWGGVGHLWNKDVVFVFVRPSRYTLGFMEASSHFVLSFFDEAFRPALKLCGSVSGRDHDKAALTGLHPEVFAPPAPSLPCVGFAEARMELLCRKLHAQTIEPGCFVDPAIAQNYPSNDWHRMYIGAIERARSQR